MENFKVRPDGQPNNLLTGGKSRKLKKFWVGLKEAGVIAKKGAKKTIKSVIVLVLTYGVIAFIVIGGIAVYRVVEWTIEVKNVASDAVQLWGIDSDIRAAALKNAQIAQREIGGQRENLAREGIEKYFPNQVVEAKEEKDVWQMNLNNLKFTLKEGQEVIRIVTAYNSEKNQTDETPCFAEPSQNNLCMLYQEGSLYKEKGLQICASNAFDLGTELEIRRADKSLFAKCIVLDRMNGKYNGRVDIFFDKDIERAQKFGKQKLWVKQTGFYKNFEKLAPSQEPII